MNRICGNWPPSSASPTPSSLLGRSSAGIKKVKENPQIARLKDPNDTSFNYARLYDTVKQRSYEFLVKLSAAHYFPLTRASTLKLGFNGGVFSSPNTYRNELFLIGGYRLLRGFDEQSILASQYFPSAGAAWSRSLRPGSASLGWAVVPLLPACPTIAEISGNRISWRALVDLA